MLHLNITVKKPARTKIVKQRECCYVYHVWQNIIFNPQNRVYLPSATAYL